MHNINAGTGGLLEFEELIGSFKEAGYQFVFFDELVEGAQQIVLRHDIDFDLRAAYEIALKEQQMGIKSSFFLLLSNKNFNLLNHETFSYVKKISAMGHHISLQFDPANYPENEESGLKIEIELFEKIFEEKIKVFSFHRPSQQEMNSGIWLNGIRHTYLPEFTKEILYISDSRGLWRFGHPLETEAFRNKLAMHILLHPVWWFYKGKTNTEKIKNTFLAKVNEIKKNFSDNSRTFREIENDL